MRIRFVCDQNRISFLFIGLFVFLWLNNIQCATDNVTLSSLSPVQKNEIVFGQTGMLSGHFKQYSNPIIHGIEACFQKINRAGGINGKKLRLISLDDFGIPETAEENIKKLKSLGVDMFIGNMGTRSILRSLPLIENKEIAVFFPWGGDDSLRKPTLTNIINGLGLLKPQVTKLVDYATNHLGIKKIAIFHADDGFSIQTQQELVQELIAHKVNPIKIAEYNRYTLDIATPADLLMQSDPKAVMCIATSLPTVKLVNRFFEKGHFGTVFLGIDSTLFARDILAARGIPFYFSSAVPDPRVSSIQIAQDYLADLAELNKEYEPNVLSFAYYISAAIIIDAIKNTQEPFTKEKIIAQIEGMKDKNLNGFMVNFDAQTRHAFGNDVSIIKG